MQKNRLKKHYDLIVRYDSMIQLPLINAAETPEISHIILNKGLGNKAVVDRKRVLPSALALELISGQRPYITEAKKSIDKFKLRQGMPIGCKVTLRGAAAYLFLDRLMLRIFPKIIGSSQKTHNARRAPSGSPLAPKGGRGVSKYKPGIRSVAYGMRDLYVYEEILRIGEVDEHLGGFDIVCVYRSRPFFHNPSSASSLTSTRRRRAEVADSDNSSLLAFVHKYKSRRRCRRVSPGRANLFNEWLRLEE